MEKKSSKQALKKEAWRTTDGWGKSVRDELKAQVAAFRPPSIPLFNILLTGPIGSGKSSFINSINWLIKDAILFTKAPVGEKAFSLTKEFHRYWMNGALPLTVYDTMGIDPDTSNDVYIDNILEAVEGHVPDGYVFTRGKKFHRLIPGYIENPTLADRAHCVAIVVDAAKVFVMPATMIEKLKSLADGLYERKTPCFVLLTHMDEFYHNVDDDITTMFHSTAVGNLVIKISKMLHGFPEYRIFPVINYTTQVELNDNVDVLILYALRQILGACCDNLEKQESEEAVMIQNIPLLSLNKPQPILWDKPWRETKGWGESVRDELKAEVAALRSPSIPEIPSLNILLAGPIGSGKSSSINSISCVIRGGLHLDAGAGVGRMGTSLTEKFSIYQITPDFRICDTMGIDGRSAHDVDIRNIMKAVNGHVPRGYKFIPGREFLPQSRSYIANPQLADAAHCVAIVVDARPASQMTDKMVQKLKNLADCFFKEEIPFVVLLTGIDQFCQEVEKDIKTMYRSTAVENLVLKISSMVHGLPENHIFPVVNYTKRVEIDADTDIPLLYVLRKMLGASISYIQKCKPEAKQKSEAVPIKFGQQEEGAKAAVKGKIPTEWTKWSQEEDE